MPAVHKIAISRKTKSFGTFRLFLLDSMNLWHYQSNYLKDSKSTNFNMWPTPSKTLGDHPRKRRWGNDGPFLSFSTKCRGRATYNPNQGRPTFLSNGPYLLFKNFCGPKFSTMATLSDYKNNLKNHGLFPIQTSMQYLAFFVTYKFHDIWLECRCSNTQRILQVTVR